MPRRSSPAHAGAAALIVLVLTGLAGCRSEERRLEELRAQLRLEVVGFVVEQRPVVGRAGGATGSAPALAQDVRVDLLLRRVGGAEAGADRETGPLELPVDLTLAAPDGAARRTWPAVLEVPGGVAAEGEPVKVSYFLRGVPYRPGDRFKAVIKGRRPAGARTEAGPDP